MVLVELSEDDLLTLTVALVDSYRNGDSRKKKQYQELHDRIQEVRKRL